MRVVALIALLLLGGCETARELRRSADATVGSGETIAIYGLEGRWAGPVTPTADKCGAATTGLMSIGSKGFAFDPFQSTTTLNGTVSEQGKFAGSFSRPGGSGGGGAFAPPGSPPPKKAAAPPPTLSIALDAQASKDAQGDRIDGTLTSGRCTWSVALRRA